VSRQGSGPFEVNKGVELKPWGERGKKKSMEDQGRGIEGRVQLSKGFETTMGPHRVRNMKTQARKEEEVPQERQKVKDRG